jgi:Mn-dependent DtxR family transcriptional regulator
MNSENQVCNEILREFLCGKKNCSLKVIACLSNNTQKMCLSKITKIINVSHSSVSNVIKPMEKIGIIKFEYCGNKKIVCLTEKGKKLSELLKKLD